ncbi:flagellar hook-associated protein FlgK [Frigidibacter sp. MR17.14]|uniref:flagellar hook-associated protein FlgK n=1 Tax=Frigidibacter sp. MR17.14 TaxID=3126509 RepID=UPI003012B51F
MSLGTALSNAVSGLTATARAAEVVSNNVSNALTPGYAKRELMISSRLISGAAAGVKIDGVVRVQDKVALSTSRTASSASARDTLISSFGLRMEQVFGLPDAADSLSGRLDGFDAALVAAMNEPSSDAYLRALSDSAAAVSDRFNEISDAIQSERLAADNQIASQVRVLNDSLASIDALNREIVKLRLRSDDVSGLIDQRQVLVDRISAIVPVRELDRQGGTIALYTEGGAMLLEGKPVKIEFSPVGVIDPESSVAGGALSGLTIGDRSYSAQADEAFAGGSLQALFQLRDETAPAMQRQIDALARDLVERFQDPTLDTTLSTGDAGLFTDGGAAFDPANEVGLAGRMRLNAAVDLAAGGQAWHLRDGLGAISAGAPGNSTLLEAMSDRLREARVPVSGSYLGAQKSTQGLAADLLSQIAQDRLAAEDRSAASTARLTAAQQTLARDGVDTDQEIQTLLVVQQAYAANAKVIQTLDDLLTRLMEI